MSELLNIAKEIEKEIIDNRRYLHNHAEINSDLHLTTEFVKRKLVEIGCTFNEVTKCGLVTTIGTYSRGKTILLRADMDGLSIKEENELDFKSVTDYGHCCGHDLHVAMLLGAAKILKKYENQLNGSVKLMFQPDEEGGEGAHKMVQAGVLKNPEVDAAFAIHVDAKSPLNQLNYGCGCTFASNDSFEIVIKGKGGHGARPHDTVDPINIACHIHLALQALISRESNPSQTVILSIGAFNSGSAYNIIPDTAVLKGSLRTYDMEQREYLIKRINKICKLTANSFKGDADLIIKNSVPPLYCDEKLCHELLTYSIDILGRDKIEEKPTVKMGSEDFSYISQNINTAYFFIGAGLNEKEGYEYGQHTSRVVFNEGVLHKGAALLAHCAYMWLKNN